MAHPFGEAFVAEYAAKKRIGRLAFHKTLKRKAKKKAANAKRHNQPKPKPWKPKYLPDVPLFADGRVDYRAYIKSDRWKKKRLKALRRAKGKCETCGKAAPLQVHHKDYRRLGRERHMDIIALCDGCHSIEHDDRVLARDDVSREFQRFASSL